ncbi:MAG: hypothetical protein ACLSVX_02605 [Massilimicrobiota timonensis]
MKKRGIIKIEKTTQCQTIEQAIEMIKKNQVPLPTGTAVKDSLRIVEEE